MRLVRFQPEDRPLVPWWGRVLLCAALRSAVARILALFSSPRTVAPTVIIAAFAMAALFASGSPAFRGRIAAALGTTLSLPALVGLVLPGALHDAGSPFVPAPHLLIFAILATAGALVSYLASCDRVTGTDAASRVTRMAVSLIGAILVPFVFLSSLGATMGAMVSLALPGSRPGLPEPRSPAPPSCSRSSPDARWAARWDRRIGC